MCVRKTFFFDSINGLYISIDARASIRKGKIVCFAILLLNIHLTICRRSGGIHIYTFIDIFYFGNDKRNIFIYDLNDVEKMFYTI